MKTHTWRELGSVSTNAHGVTHHCSGSMQITYLGLDHTRYIAHSLTHKHTHTHTLTHSHSHTHTHSHAHEHALTHTHTHTYTHSPALKVASILLAVVNEKVLGE